MIIVQNTITGSRAKQKYEIKAFLKYITYRTFVALKVKTHDFVK